MNQIAKIQKSPVEEFVAAVLPSDRIEDLRQSLPAHIKAETVQRNLLNAIMNTPKLMDCAPGLIFREISKAAALGLFLDKDLGEAYLIVGSNNEPQLRIGYRGFVKLGRQSGQVSMIYAHEVCANDVFRMSLGTEKLLAHELPGFTERGPVVGYYAVVKYTNGDFDFEPLSLADTHRIRDRSDGWKAFKAGKIKSTPWATDEVEMGKKTAIRRLTKRVPLSSELAEAIKIEDRAEFPSFNDAPAIQPRRAPPPAIEHRAPEPAQKPASIEHAAPAQPEQTDRRRAPPPPPALSRAPALDIGALQEKLATALAAASDEDSANDAYTYAVGDAEAQLSEADLGAMLQMLRNRVAELEP